jgi:hypothetical protein
MAPKLTGSEALAAWSKAAEQSVMLPSGLWARVRVPSAELLIRSGRVPDNLRKIALAFATTGVKIEDLDPEEGAHFLQFLYVLAAESLRGLAPKGSDPNDADAFALVRVTGAELRESEVPVEDVYALVSIANRTKSPGDVTTASMIANGLADAAVAAAQNLKGGKPTLPDYADFRRVADGASDRDDSATVRPAAIDPHRDRRPADRVRGRRSSGDPARD